MPLPTDPSNGKVIVQGYVPSIPLSVVGIAVFGLMGAVFVFRWLKTRKARYMLWITLGSLFMSLGFIVRIVQHMQPTSIPIYSLSTMILLLSPCAFIAQDYYTLPHLATSLGLDDCLFLKPRIIGRVFLLSDCTTFFIQLAGSGMTAVTSIAKIGSTIAMVGLIGQLVSFAVFVLLLVRFGFQVKKKHPEKWTNSVGPINGRTVKLGWNEDWRTVWYALCWTTIGILVRCVFRVIEFAEGYDGKLRTTEPYFYALDALPLALAIAVWTFVWPPKILGAVDQATWNDETPMMERDNKSPSGSASA